MKLARTYLVVFSGVDGAQRLDLVAQPVAVEALYFGERNGERRT